MSIVQDQTVTAADVLALVDCSLTAALTKSLTTVAGQRVFVLAKGYLSDGAVGEGDNNVLLKYNSVTKDSVIITLPAANRRGAFMLMYTETPGAATANITLECAEGTIAAPVIAVLTMNNKS